MRYDRAKQEVMHITPVLAKLHWLPVNARATFKMATLVYNIRQTGSPSYLASLLSDYNPIRHLPSTDRHLLAARSRLKTSKGAFHHAAVAVWNTRPLTIRDCGTVGSFRKHLKTHMCNISYRSTWSVSTPRLRLADPHIGVVDKSFTYLLTYTVPTERCVCFPNVSSSTM